MLFRSMAATAVFARLCYSVGDTRGPVGAALVGVAVMLATQSILAPAVGLGSLAAGVAIGEWIECGLLMARVRSRVDGPTISGFLSGVPMCTLLSVGAAALAFVIVALGSALGVSRDWLSSAFVTMAAGGASLVAYLSGTALVGLQVAGPIVRRVSRIAPLLNRLAAVGERRGGDR